MVCDSRLVDSHPFWGVLYFKVHFFQAIIDLFAAKPFFRSFFMKVFLTCKNKAKSASVPWQKYLAISFAILNSQELFSVLFLQQIGLWFENPKSLQNLQNALRDTTNFTVNKETLGTFVPNIRDMSYISGKTGWSLKDGLEGHLGKLCTHDVQPANSHESLLAHFGILTCLHEMSGLVGGLRYLRRCLQALPSSLPAIFCCLCTLFARLHWLRAWHRLWEMRV